MSDFIQKAAEDLAEHMNNKIAEVMLGIIETTIGLSDIIAEENLAIVKEFKESMDKVPEEDKHLYLNHEPQVLKFDNTSDKFSYGFKKLIQNGYSLLHTTLPDGRISISLYKLVGKEEYIIDYKKPDVQIKKS